MNDFQIEMMLAGEAAEHSTIVSVGKQIFAMYQAKAAAIADASNEFNAAAAKITSTGIDRDVEEVGIVMQLMKLNPSFVPDICKILDLIGPNIPELKQTLTELQAKAMQTT